MNRRAGLSVGLHFTATDVSMPVVEFARAAAERGFSSVVLPEHTHIPVESRFPTGDGTVPERYVRILDPYISLAVMAASTGLDLGTCISLVAQHDPVALAKTIATLDHISGGRFTLGVGYGWNHHELTDHGVRFAERRAVAREYVAAMRALWTETEAEFHGEHVDVMPSWAWPKPARERSIPVLLGCSPTDRGFADVAAWADGWLPVCPHPQLLDRWLPVLRQHWDAAGRSSPPVIWVLHHSLRLDADLVRANLDRFADVGVDQVLLDVDTGSRDEMLSVLDRYAGILATTT